MMERQKNMLLNILLLIYHCTEIVINSTSYANRYKGFNCQTNNVATY